MSSDFTIVCNWLGICHEDRIWLWAFGSSQIQKCKGRYELLILIKKLMA